MREPVTTTFSTGPDDSAGSSVVCACAAGGIAAKHSAKNDDVIFSLRAKSM
jgi:hypothetical protein